MTDWQKSKPSGTSNSRNWRTTKPSFCRYVFVAVCLRACVAVAAWLRGCVAVAAAVTVVVVVAVAVCS